MVKCPCLDKRASAQKEGFYPLKICLKVLCNGLGILPNDPFIMRVFSSLVFCDFPAPASTSSDNYSSHNTGVFIWSSFAVQINKHLACILNIKTCFVIPVKIKSTASHFYYGYFWQSCRI